MLRLRSRISHALTCATLVWASSAYAGDATLAESLFREGKALMQQGDFARACPKLEESNRQDPASGTLLALAFCHEQAGNTATAWGTYNQAVLRARQEGRSDREQAARERGEALEPNLSRLLIDVAPAAAALPGFSVKRDGQPVPPAAWGSPTPVDPGAHVIEASADGKKPFEQRVELGKAGDRQSVQIPVLADAPKAAAGVPATQTAATATESAQPAQRRSSPLRTIGIFTGAAGIVALGVGAGFALHAKSLDTQSQEDGHCDAETGCDEEGDQLNQDALGAAGVATGLVVAGGILVAGGLTLFFIGGSSASEKKALSLTPLVGSSGGGVLVKGGF